jgi:hypothetical protein
MKFWHASILFIFLALNLSACGSKDVTRIVAKGGEQIKVSEIHTLFAGSKVKMIGYKEDADLILHLNGRVSAQNTNDEKNDGIWSVDEQDRFCLKFKRWGGGDKLCYEVYKLDNEYIFFQKNSKRYTVTITENNFEIPQTPSESKGTGKKEQMAREPQSLENTSSSMVAKESSSPAELTPQSRQEIGVVIRELAQNCPGCNLIKANLTGANLSHANLAGANLAEADLRFANLRRANLKGANLYKADLTGADIGGIELEGANLQGVIGLP